ncbi:hypothetical protein TNCV_933001 [Trichonephila clavipes]|nr:hypothetical protein TNCV_933001 [Trichonephila clavipes]
MTEFMSFSDFVNLRLSFWVLSDPYPLGIVVYIESTKIFRSFAVVSDVCDPEPTVNRLFNETTSMSFELIAVWNIFGFQAAICKPSFGILLFLMTSQHLKKIHILYSSYNSRLADANNDSRGWFVTVGRQLRSLRNIVCPF